MDVCAGGGWRGPWMSLGNNKKSQYSHSQIGKNICVDSECVESQSICFQGREESLGI